MIDDSPVDLSYKEFELLAYFMENKGIALFLLKKQTQRLAAVARLNHRIAALCQKVFYQFPHPALIVYYQNLLLLHNRRRGSQNSGWRRASIGNCVPDCADP